MICPDCKKEKTDSRVLKGLSCTSCVLERREHMQQFETDDKVSSKEIQNRYHEALLDFRARTGREPKKVRLGVNVVNVLLTEASHMFSMGMRNIVQFAGLEVEKVSGDTIEVL